MVLYTSLNTHFPVLPQTFSLFEVFNACSLWLLSVIDYDYCDWYPMYKNNTHFFLCGLPVMITISQNQASLLFPLMVTDLIL